MQGEERDREGWGGGGGRAMKMTKSSEDAQMTGERESAGNSLGETHCRRNVNPNY